MNIVKLMGGLGNQLFQYAFGRAMMDNGIEVTFDDSWYNTIKPQKHPRLLEIQNFVPKFTVENFKKQEMINERFTPNYDLDLLQKKDSNFEGYWQYPEYSDNIIEDLREEFGLKEKYLGIYYNTITRFKDGVSVHVRRGDYITDRFPLIPLRFYFNAIRETTGPIYIFSDDIPWCEVHFKQCYFSRPVFFMKENTCLSFELMRTCSQNIIANSTFSWWAAHLNTNPNKKVIAPSGWIGDCHGNAHYPKEWIILEHQII